MAGQGLNLGIADADALARAVLEGRRSGADLGSELLLKRYEDERKVHARLFDSCFRTIVLQHGRIAAQ